MELLEKVAMVLSIHLTEEEMNALNKMDMDVLITLAIDRYLTRKQKHMPEEVQMLLDSVTDGYNKNNFQDILYLATQMEGTLEYVAVIKGKDKRLVALIQRVQNKVEGMPWVIEHAAWGEENKEEGG